MADYKKVRHRQRPRPVERPKPDGNFWSKFIKPTDLSFPGAVYAVDFNPLSPYDALLTASARLSLVSLSRGSPKVSKTFSRFNGLAYSGVFRPTDGKLIACGDDNGVVTVFDVATKASLRQFTTAATHRGTTGAAARIVRWRKDGLALFSGSDDKCVRYWDLGTAQLLTTIPQAHKDYVRCGAINPAAASELFVSGSYDHTLKVWDMRGRGGGGGGSNRPVSRFNHGCPVEACLALPGGSLLVSAGGETIKVWDLLGGGGGAHGGLLHAFSNHAKTITSLTTDREGSRLLSASLDGHVKVYDLQTYDVLHSFRAAGPLLSVGLAPDNRKLVMGQADGTFSVRTRRSALTSTSAAPISSSSGLPSSELPRTPLLFGGTARHFHRGKNAVAGAGDFQVELAKRQRLAPYDVSLKGFRYHEALDKALASRNPRTIVAVLDELIMRRGLRVALTGRDEAGMEPLLAFLARYLNHPDYASSLSDVCHMVLDIYAPMLGQSPVLDELIGRVARGVKAEVAVQREMLGLVGAMDMLIATQLEASVGEGGRDGGWPGGNEEELISPGRAGED